MPTDERNYPHAAPVKYHLLAEVALAAPFYQYAAMYASEPYAFLLDSAKPSDRLGQFSFLGGDPFLVYKAHRRLSAGSAASAAVEVIRRHDSAGELLARPHIETREAELFDDLRRVLRAEAVPPQSVAETAVPLLSGAVGYFGYEAGHFVEELPDNGSDELGLPDVYFALYDVVLAHCHQTERTYLSVVGRGENAEAARQCAVRRRERMLARIAAFEPCETSAPAQNGVGWQQPVEGNGATYDAPATMTDDVQSSFDIDSYGRLVDTVKEHIFAGDAFEVCLTHRLAASLSAAPWDLYRELRRISPAPFAAYLQFPEASVISSSPERYVRLGADRVAESRPIKGTRPRGSTPEVDAAIYTDLYSSAKDRAENVMIVDLVRNDLGRVCRFGSVEVPELMAIEAYATVYQMVSTVRGRLRDDADVLDLIRATFPGGSMTGAPKIEAMKIIDRLEPVKRGVYSGAIGYLDFRGTADLSIAIRTIVARAGKAYFNVGGAVVADSAAGTEYRETLDKAQAMVRAIRAVNARAAADGQAANGGASELADEVAADRESAAKTSIGREPGGAPLCRAGEA